MKSEEWWFNYWETHLDKDVPPPGNDFNFPSPQLLAFIKFHVSLYIENQKKLGNDNISFLDIGCAEAKPLVHLKEQLFFIKSFFLLDVNENLLLNAKKNLSNTYPNANISTLLVNMDGTINCEDNSIDIANAESSLYLNNSYELFEKAILEIYRCLKVGGICRIYTKSDKDRYAISSWKTNRYTYKVQNEGHWEDQGTVICISKEKLEDLLGIFTWFTIGIEENDYTGSSGLKSFYVITAKK